MIATRNEDPRRLARENTYAVRRILIRRLQRATRGIPRRLRAELHLQFVREWKNLVHQGGLVTLQGELARSRPGDGMSLLSRLVSDFGGSGAPGPVSTGPAGPERQDGLPQRGSGAERARERVPAPLPGSSEPRQAELFQLAMAS